MKISDHIHLLKIPFKIHLSPDIAIDRFVNSFIIVGKEITLIDTGTAGSEKIIFNYLKSIGRSVEEISLILLTHSHPDHIGSAHTIKEISKCRLAIHENEKNWIEDVNIQFNQRPVPGFHQLVSGSSKVDFLLNENEILTSSSHIKIRIIHCPGHSSGSVAFHILPDNVIISGDVIPVKNDIPIYDDWQLSLNSVKQLQKEAIDSEALLASWDSPKIGVEISDAFIDGINVLNSVHEAFSKVVTTDTGADIKSVCQKVLEKMGLPSKFINPLFLRALQSHYKYM